MHRFLFARLCCALAAFLTASHPEAAPASNPGLPPATNAIAEVEAGRTTIANAAWWGFDPADATDSLQAAIRSKARKVVVPLMPGPWVLRPIQLRSDLELEFQPGVLVLAKPGEFRGGGDSLFRGVDLTNVTLRGHGAILRMRKSDYQKPPYPKAEWRMGITLSGCRNALIEGFRIESTGGDGLYVGSSKAIRWCEDVVIRDCTCVDNHRQGLSVISAVNLLVERCTFSSTDGTPPEAGIDFEPDEPDERLVRCVVRDCVVENNSGNGLLVYLKPLTRDSQPVSIRLENCHVRMGHPGSTPAELAAADAKGWSGIAVGKVADNGPQGLIEFIRCTSENTGREAVRLFDKSARGVRVRFEECRWNNSWTARHREFAGPRVPILFRQQESGFCTETGGVEFVDCQVFDTLDGPVARFESDSREAVLRDVSGRLTVVNPHGTLVHPSVSGPGVSLTVTPQKP